MTAKEKNETTFIGKPYELPTEQSDMLNDAQIPIVYHDEKRDTRGKLRVLSLFWLGLRICPDLDMVRNFIIILVSLIW